MSLDARTLLVIGGFLCWLLAAAIEFQAVRPSGKRVLPDAWTIGLLAKGLGLNLISQRGLIADAWSIALANALLLTGLLFNYVALQRLRGAAINPVLLAAMPLGLAIILPVIGFSPEAFPTRVFAIMCAWVFGFALSCWAAVQILRAGYLAGASMILASNSVLATLAIGFAVAVIAREISGVFTGGGAQLAFYAINDVCIAISTFGYMDIVRVARSQKPVVDDVAQPDRLTGLYSNQAFAKISVGELHRAGRRGYPACALAISIDGLDVIRALRGPAFSDRALKRVAAVVLHEIRIYDVAGRVADNLIGIVMPEVALAAGLEVAERIRAKVAGEDATSDNEPAIRVSVGICEAQDGEHDFDKLMAAASACLARAQSDGGNQVVTPNSPPSKAFVEGTI